MSPDEISSRFGSDALDMLYDSMLQTPTHVLVDWVLSYLNEEEVREWVTRLTTEGESK